MKPDRSSVLSRLYKASRRPQASCPQVSVARRDDVSSSQEYAWSSAVGPM
jgi:hypothetical protein